MIYSCLLQLGGGFKKCANQSRRRIPIHERVELPDELIPADSRVEIDAKITAGKSMAVGSGVRVARTWSVGC